MLPGVKKTGENKETTDKKDTSTKGAFSLPSISIPKGGGTIRGIGEKFAANPVTGTGSINVPISVSNGRSSFGPQLSLSYDSGSGNGPFGFGWSLSLPAITRKTDKGLPLYQDAVDSDIFILSGAEDLVPVYKKGEDGNWIRDIKGNCVFDEEERDGYVVRRYRPRVEGLFARIERWTRKSDGIAHWRSISKENILTIYGRDEKSQILDPEDAKKQRIFCWLLCESYDDKGNAIVYEHAAENENGLDLSPVSEFNRSRTANRYIKRILYGNRQPLLLDITIPGFRKPHTELPDFTSAMWMFEVVFDYGEGHYTMLPKDAERPEAEQHQLVEASETTDGLWPGRPDPFSTYKSGFEIRTYRRCQRALMFHRFPELGTEPCLVGSTEFDYSDMDYSHPIDIESELEYNGSTKFASFIRAVIQSGYVRVEHSDGNKYPVYLKKSLPPLEFQYSHISVKDNIKEMNAGALDNMPCGIDGTQYKMVDLDGEGLPGVITEQADAWFYKRNLGDGSFGPMERVSLKPSLASLVSGRQQFMDLAGDGQLDLVEFEGSMPGFYERTEDEGWDNFTPFESLPNISWKDPNLKFIDLTGDGHADIMVSEEDAFTWYPSLAEQGFGPYIKTYQAINEEKGPRLIFNDGTESIYLADMSGDGLVDLVRVRNGEICYWPSLGYGRFGPRITMDNAPWFDEPDQFNQKRIRLADIDGSGTTDLIYLGNNGVSIYFNKSGNSLSEVRILSGLPHIDNFSSIQTADLLGNGTACLVWSSSLPGDSSRPMCYIDLMGGQKPHLLVSSKNNMGAETKVVYAASTKFYLADRAAGKPWVTRIPFPVHVVERVETYDYISRNRFVTRYAYHHGYFDGIEREFRGFGMVEQWDTDEMGNIGPDTIENDTNWDVESFVPPVLTRTWHHTGAYQDESRISRQFEDEYYKESDASEGILGLTDAQMRAMLMDDTILPDTIWLGNGIKSPYSLSIDEIHEACRALKGSVLRREVYAVDGTDEDDRPYMVSERNYTIEMVQAIGGNKHGIFFTHPRETVDFYYERKLFGTLDNRQADPRVSHKMILDVDQFGDILRSAAIGYGRRYDNPDPALTEDEKKKQDQTMVTFTVSQYTVNVDEPDVYHTPMPWETRVYELLKASPDLKEPSVTNLFRFKEMGEKIDKASDGYHDIPYEDLYAVQATDDAPYRRLIEEERTLYRSNDFKRCLDAGQLQSMAFPFESYKLAYTPGLVAQVYGENTTDEMFIEGGYVHIEDDNNWWIPSGRIFFSPGINDTSIQELSFASQHFFQQHKLLDPFGNISRMAYDDHCLLLLETEDALHNKVSAGERDAAGHVASMNDYRVLQPALVTDANGNRTAAAYDALYALSGTAQMGKEGDS